MNTEGSTLRVLPKKEGKDEIYAQLAPGKGKKKQQAEETNKQQKGNCKQTRALTLAEFHRNQEEKAKWRDSPLPPPQVVVPAKWANMPSSSRPPPPLLAGEKGKGKELKFKGIEERKIVTEESRKAEEKRELQDLRKEEQRRAVMEIFFGEISKSGEEAMSRCSPAPVKSGPMLPSRFVNLEDLGHRKWLGKGVSSYYRIAIRAAVDFVYENWNKFGSLQMDHIVLDMLAHQAHVLSSTHDFDLALNFETGVDRKELKNQFADLILAILGETCDAPSGYYHNFLQKMHEAIENNNREEFRQLKMHPLLLSTPEKKDLLLLSPRALKGVCGKQWEQCYKYYCQATTEMYEVITQEEAGYYQVLFQTRRRYPLGPYEANSLGSVKYARNLIKHLIKYHKDFGREIPNEDELIQKLEYFFPHILVELYHVFTALGVNMDLKSLGEEWH